MVSAKYKESVSMARATNGNGAASLPVPSARVGFPIVMDDVLVHDVYRGNNEDGSPQDRVYLTVKTFDGCELKFSTDQLSVGQERQLWGVRVSFKGSLRGRRFGKDQSLETVGAVAFGAPIAASE